MGSVVTVIVSMLLLLNFLDNPFHAGVGGVGRWRWSGRCGSSTRRCRGGQVDAPATRRVRLVNEQRRDWVELIAVVLLAFAAVATAWSSYQATRWNGEQAKTSGSVNETRIEAARASGLANAQNQVDIATFVSGSTRTRQRRRLASFYASASARSSSPRSRRGSRRSRSRPRTRH